MTRPEHVRCENCCYWEAYGAFEDDPVGTCCRYAPTAADETLEHVPACGEESFLSDCSPTDRAIRTFSTYFCGEFATEWPDVPRGTSEVPRLLQLYEASKKLGVSVKMIRGWIVDGGLPTVKVGTRIRVTEADLVEFIEKRKQSGDE